MANDVGVSARSNRVLAAIAIVGLISAVIAWLYMDRRIADAKPEEAVKILVADEDLRPGRPLSAESVRVGEIPAGMSQLAAMSLRPEQISAVEGAQVSRFIPAGTPLLYADLAEVRDIKLEEPWRALTLSVSEASAMDGLLVPGDLVEMYVTRQISRPTAQPSGTDTAAIMQAFLQSLRPDPNAEYMTSKVGETPFEVVAVGGRLSGTRQQMLTQNEPTGLNTSSVTVKVRSDQIEMLLRSTAAGALPVQLVLCPKPVAAPR